PSRARRADRSDAAPPDGRALLGFRAIASSFTYAIPAGTTGATDPRLGGLLLPGHRGRREPRPRQGWQAEVLAGAVQGVVDVAVDVLPAELVVQPRPLERDHGLGLHVRKQHQRALAAASLYLLACRVQARRVDRLHVPHAHGEHLGMGSDGAEPGPAPPRRPEGGP